MVRMMHRKETDVLGTVEVPENAYYGSETERAVENFRISGLRIQEGFISAYALLKRAAAEANMKAGSLDKKKGRMIVRSADEVMSGKLRDQFVIDVFQAGAGTSTNMNVNEVIANRAIELLGGKKGEYEIVHPNDHVNMSQSTNDTYHTVMRIAAHTSAKNLLHAMWKLSSRLGEKALVFRDIIKVGRTHLQDAVPMKLGQEFSGYNGMVIEAIETLEHAMDALLEVPIGGTALGTGMNASRGYKEDILKEIRKGTGEKFRASRHIFADMQGQVAELRLNGALETIAISVNKIANDFRILGSGPRAGIGELLLPEVQPGSSIMPGKINPSMAEMLNMVCFQVLGNCATVKEAANAGQLELNVFMPVIAYNLLFSMGILTNGITAFSEKCVRGVKAEHETIRRHLEMDLSMATALAPHIGYSKAAKIARKAYEEGKSVKEVCIIMKIMDRETLDRILDPKNNV